MLGLSLVSCDQSMEKKFKIVKIIDGDTFIDNKKTKYRLLGVDTPESFDSSNNFEETKGIQKFFAAKAAKLTSKTILNKYVIIDKWKVDIYKRVVAKIKCNSISLAKVLLSNGLARVKYISPNENNYFYYPDTNYYNQLIEIEQYAKINKIGIWKLSTKEQKQVFPK